jgi:hypothetical protein
MEISCKRLLPLLLLLTLPAVAQAQFVYTTNNGTITITGYTGFDWVLTIPDTINGLPVTRIGSEAFENTIVFTVRIGNRVTDIETKAFYECTGINNVTIPGSVTNIEDQAFFECTGLGAITVDTNNPVFSSVAGVLFNRSQTTLIQYPGALGAYTIPSSVTMIGSHAFDACYNLTSVTIPNSVTNIGDAAFNNCFGLTAITVDVPSAAYSSVDGVLFDQSQTTLILYPLGKPGGYMVPNGVASIGPYAFHYCTSLTNLTIPDSVTNIGTYAFLQCTSLTNLAIGFGVTSMGTGAFYDCTSLTSITISDGVTTIGDSAFEYCTSLPSMTFPDSVTRIGDDAFSSCSSLTNITIPSSVTTIGDGAFSWCGSLSGVKISNGVLSIGAGAFSVCSSLTSVSIPGSVTSIKEGAFSACTSLTEITVDALNPAYTSVSGVLFNKAQTTLLQCPAAKAVAIYTITNTVTSIGSGAFQDTS